MGKNSVLAILSQAPQRIFKIQLAEESRQDKRIYSIVQLAQSEGITYQWVPKAKLDTISQRQEEFTPHQGVIAMVSPKPLLDIYDLVQQIKALPEGVIPLVVALDEVTDAHNFGALIRVAAGAGATAIIIPKTGSAGFSPVVSKASAGTVELMDIVVVPNLVEAMTRLKDCGIWWAGAAVDEKAIRYETYDYTSPTGIVLGSEDKGLRRLVAETCDQLIHIPLHQGVESLNVSVAGGIILFEALRQRHVKAK